MNGYDTIIVGLDFFISVWIPLCGNPWQHNSIAWICTVMPRHSRREWWAMHSQRNNWLTFERVELKILPYRVIVGRGLMDRRVSLVWFWCYLVLYRKHLHLTLLAGVVWRRRQQHPLKRGQCSMWSYHVVRLQAWEYVSWHREGKDRDLSIWFSPRLKQYNNQRQMPGWWTEKSTQRIQQ